MANFEGTRRQRLEWIEARTALWQANAAAIGLTAGQVTSLKGQVLQNRTDLNASEAARNAAKAATFTFYTSGNTMDHATRDLIAVIKGFAESTNNPNVYALANVEPPAPPSVLPAPATPSDFTGSVTTGGDVVLTWKAVPSGRSSGVFFLARRKRAEGEWESLGGTAEKSFIDPDPQFGVGVIRYQVKAVRGELESEWTNELAFDLAGAGGQFRAGFVGTAATPTPSAQAA